MCAAALIGVGGYVLAGGKSSRMGTDKAVIELAGRPLIARAVEKLRQICAEVYILSSNSALEAYAPLVRDLHEDCGPIGGLEAALAHSRFDWNLLLPVDVPFIPVKFLLDWAQRVTARADICAAYFELDGKPQPGVLLIRRQAGSSIRNSILRGQRKLLPAIAEASLGSRVWVETLSGANAQRWFVNVNTPNELETAKSHLLIQGSGDAS